MGSRLSTLPAFAPGVHHDRSHPPRLVPRGGRAPFRPALQRPAVPGADRPPRSTTTRRGPGRTLLSIKTGGCPEDCGYCPQAARYSHRRGCEKLMSVEAVVAKAQAAKAAGASRFCMGAAWRSPKDRDVPKVAAMVARGEVAGPGDLRHARHAQRPQARHAEGGRAGLTTTTTWIPRRSSTARSSTRATTRTASTRSTMCATPA